MKKPRRENIRTLLISLLAILLPIALLLAYKLWPSPSPAGTEKLIPVDGLIRGEVYFYGPSDNDIRERYNGSDEERTLIFWMLGPLNVQIPLMGTRILMAATSTVWPTILTWAITYMKSKPCPKVPAPYSNITFTTGTVRSLLSMSIPTHFR